MHPNLRSASLLHRMSSRVTLFLAVSLGLSFLSTGCRDRKPVEFVRSRLSDAWPVFTCSELGFEIKYPPDSQYTQSLRHGVVNFRGGSGNVNVCRFDEAMLKEMEKQMEALYPKQNPLSSNGRKVKIGDLIGKSAVPGNGYIDSVIIERGSYVYEITWGLNSASVGEEMAATFRFIDIKHSDYLSYSDPVYGIAFDYPYNWTVVSWKTNGSVSISGGDFSIDIKFRAGTTFEDFVHQQYNQVSDVEEVREHFLHHLVGRRCRWLGRETYALEHQGGTYLVWIDRTPTGSVSRKSLDDFLDSLRL